MSVSEIIAGIAATVNLYVVLVVGKQGKPERAKGVLLATRFVQVDWQRVVESV